MLRELDFACKRRGTYFYYNRAAIGLACAQDTIFSLIPFLAARACKEEEEEGWCTSTLHIGWGLCDRVRLVLVCRGRYIFWGGGSSLHSGIEFGRSRTGEGSSGGRKKRVV